MGSERAACLALIVAALGIAQPTTTTITDTLYNGDGSLFSGTVQIASQTFYSGGRVVLQQVKSVQVRNGAFSTTLVPNDTSTPANTSYVFTLSNGSKMTCTIPTSATPIVLQGNCTFAAPTPPLSLVTLSQVSVPSGTVAGTYCVQIGCVGTRCTITGFTACGGTGALSWSALTSGQWASLNASQWVSLIH